MSRTATIMAPTLGAYWRELRIKRHITQAQLRLLLLEKGLKSTIKQLWSWEAGRHRPTSRAKAIVTEVLGGDPRQADALLIHDDDVIKEIATLTEQQLMNGHTTEAILKVRERARAVGQDAARAWLKTEEQRELLQGTVDAIPDELLTAANAIVAELYAVDEARLKEYIRYGEYLMGLAGRES